MVCNAPTDKSGVYIVYKIKNEHNELIYIGSSGKKLPDGTIFIRKGKLGGMKDRIVNGKQFRDVRKRSWKLKMKEEGIDKFQINWWVTHDNYQNDCPVEIEDQLQREFFNKHGQLPRWNGIFAKKS